MSFTGDLEHLPIVDVIQLMRATRKSGVLNVRGRKGESQLVFKDGFIVSASHLNNSVRIGEVLLERGAIAKEALDKALEAQSQAGADRQPLIITMLDMGLVDEKEAYAGLQALIEKTIVEILTWKKGTFLLEANLDKTADSYQYYPQNISREINVDTQGVLMDALRVFDEKMRDGQLRVEDESEDLLITEEDLGLDQLDELERQVPGVYMGLEDRALSGPPELDSEPKGNMLRRLNEAVAELPRCQSAPEVALAQLRFFGDVFHRALTFIVGKGELIAEKSIGIKAAKEEGPAPPLGFRIPLAEPSLLRRTVESGSVYCGPCDDAMVNQLFSRIGNPATENVILLPVKGFGKTAFLTYADFGEDDDEDVSVELLEMLAEQSGEALAGVLQRKKQK